MANPFLFMEDDSAGMGGETNNDAFSNPFLVDDDGQDEFSGDNPFFSGPNNPFSFGETDTDGNQVVTATTTANYFSGADTVTQADTSLFLTEDANSNEHHIDQTMAFFGTTINEHDDLQYSKPSDLNIQNQNSSLFDDPMNMYSSEEELKTKQVPPRPNPPPSQVTQLISNLTDHLDQTSTHLLGRLPKTRTPSPVSMRDFQSPSPTPDNMADLLDVSEQANTMQPQGGFQAGFYDMQNDVSSFMPVAPVSTTAASNNFISENPFAATTQTITQTQEQKPTRPPPPRPVPPRPTPPKGSLINSPVTAPTPVSTINTATNALANSQVDSDQDLFDMFGYGMGARKPPPKPPAPKSKEDILSLFSAPPPTAQPVMNQQQDLLCGDIDFGMAPPVSENNVSAQPFVNQVTTAPPVTANIVDTAPSVPLISQEISNAPLENIVEPIMEETPAMEVETQPSEPPEPKAEERYQDEFDERDMIIRPDIPQIEETLVKSLPPSSSENSPTESCNASSSGFPDSNSGSIANIPEEPEEPEPVQPDIVATTQNVTDQYVYSPEIDYAPQAADTVNPFAVEEPVMTSYDATNVFAEPITQAAPIQEPIFAPSIVQENTQSIVNDIFGTAVQQEQPQKPKPPPPPVRSYHAPAPVPTPAPAPIPAPVSKQVDDFDDFSAKFDSKVQPKATGNAFLDSFGAPPTDNADAWGDSGSGGFGADPSDGFGNEEDGFDTWNPPPAAPGSTPFDRRGSQDSDDANKEFNVFIRPKEADMSYGNATPVLAPPPQRSPHSGSVYSGDSSPRVNPFDTRYEEETAEKLPGLERSGSQDSGPPTPLFDEDVSQPLEDFPRIFYHGEGWEMQLRQPNKKKITGQRFWKKIWVRMVYQGDNPVIQLSNSATDKDPFQELPLQACYSVSEVGAQQYDNFGKIFTLKLQYVFYKERPGVRPGQVTKAERLTNKLSQFAAYAIQGDYQGVKEFGSDLKKLGLPVEHAPQMSQLFKLGSMNYEDMKQFSMCIDEALFKLNVHRDRALTYKMEEVQLTAVDELYVEQNADGAVTKQIARVRLFFLGFLSGMPDIELGVNDLWRQGKEVVGRHDIIPVVTEEWIRLEGVEFHACVQQDEYERTRTIKFKPPDACYIELMRFRVRPPKNRELPLQLKAQWVVTGNKVQLRADVLVPGFASRKLGQIPCEDVSIRFPIPECWIYLFRVEKHFRYGSVKSTHRRTGKIKGIERFLGTVETLQESLIEVTSGQAKYEHHHRAIVWRCPRLPKEGQGAYTTHQLVCRLALTSFDQIPEQLAPHAYVEFTMPATTVSHTTVRSVSVQDSESDEPPEKYVRYLARMEYRVGIEHTQGESMNPYLAATTATAPKLNQIEEQPMATTPTAPSDSDSDSN